MSSTGETLFIDQQNGPDWVGTVSQYADEPVFYDPETGQAVFPGYTTREEPEVRTVGSFSEMEVIPHSIHPVLGGQNTRESMITAGKTHSDTFFDRATGIVTEVWDNPVQEGEIRGQTTGGPTGFKLLQGSDHHVPVVRPTVYRKEDPVPDGYNTEPAYYEVVRQQTENRIRNDNAILNDYRPPQIRQVPGVIEPDIRIRPYAPNTSRNLMKRAVIGQTSVHMDAPTARQHMTYLSDQSVNTFQPGAGQGGEVESDPRRFGTFSGFLDDGTLHGASSSLLPPGASYKVESIGMSSINTSAHALSDALETSDPRYGRFTNRPNDMTTTEQTIVAPTNSLMPPLPPPAPSRTVTHGLIDNEVTNLSHIGLGPDDAAGSFHSTRPVHIPGALNREEINFNRLAPSNPQWNPHMVNHGIFSHQPHEQDMEDIQSRGTAIFSGDTVGEIASGYQSSQIMRDHNMRGQFIESTGESQDVGRTYLNNVQDQQTTIATGRPRDLIAM
jgi:hypothetical protein